jgi:hypothetical protein
MESGRQAFAARAIASLRDADKTATSPMISRDFANG